MSMPILTKNGQSIKPSLIPTDIDYLGQRAINGELTVTYLKHVRSDTINANDIVGKIDGGTWEMSGDMPKELFVK